MKKVLLMVAIVFAFAIGSIFQGQIIQFAQAQTFNLTQLFWRVYGTQTEGCTQTAVTTSGANRAGPFSVGQHYLVYGYDSAAIGTGDAIKCAWGESTVDVNSLAGSKVGETIFANQQRIFYVQTGGDYISCISATATMDYDVCPLK